MNQENNQNVNSQVVGGVPVQQEFTSVAPIGDNTGIPETPMMAPVGDNTNIPQMPGSDQLYTQNNINPVQEMINQSSVQSTNQVVNQELGLSAPIGDNIGIPEVPSAPSAEAENIQVEQTNVNQEITNDAKPPEGPSVVKPNAYNVEAVVVTEEEQLIYEYIGNNHNKIVHKRFNFAALCFGPLYYFYRKMTIYGILLTLLNVVLFNFFPLGILVLCLFCGLFTNKIYVNYVKNKINIIQKRNMDAGVPALLLICEKEGGTSGSLVLLGIILSGLISFAFSKYAADIDYKKLFKDLMNKGSEVIDKFEDEVDKFNEDSILIPIGDRKYEGTMTFDFEPNYYEVFNINFPSDFVEQKFDNLAQYLYLNNNDCVIEFYQPEGYSTGESLIKQMKNYHSPSSVLKKVTFNNIHWVSFEYEDRGISHLYGTTYNNEPYILEYRVNDGEHKDTCLLFKDQILGGISINK